MPGNNKPPFSAPKGEKWVKNGFTPEGQINWELTPSGAKEKSPGRGYGIMGGPSIEELRQKPRDESKSNAIRDWEIKNDK